MNDYIRAALLEERGGLSLKGIGEKLGVPWQGLTREIPQLLTEGLVQKNSDGGSPRYTLSSSDLSCLRQTWQAYLLAKAVSHFGRNVAYSDLLRPQDQPVDKKEEITPLALALLGVEVYAKRRGVQTLVASQVLSMLINIMHCDDVAIRGELVRQAIPACGNHGIRKDLVAVVAGWIPIVLKLGVNPILRYAQDRDVHASDAAKAIWLIACMRATAARRLGLDLVRKATELDLPDVFKSELHAMFTNKFLSAQVH